MKVKELKELLNNCDDDFNIFVRNCNGALECDNIRIIQIYGNNKNSYLIGAE